jgi:hypothetical protein
MYRNRALVKLNLKAEEAIGFKSDKNTEELDVKKLI